MEIIKAVSQKEHAFCVYIRTIVFTLGQNVPLHDEINNEEEESVNYLGFINNEPVVTARYRIVDSNIGKIERVAVLDSYQGKGYGKEIMLYLINELKKNPDIQKIKLGAQNQAMPFYERLGFSPYGDEYMDADIPHHDMIMEL